MTVTCLLGMKADNADVGSENQNGNTCSDKGSSNVPLNEAAKYWKKMGMEPEEPECSVVDSSASPIPFDKASYWKKMGIEMEAEESEPVAVVANNNTSSFNEANYWKKMGMEVEEEEPE